MDVADVHVVGPGSLCDTWPMRDRQIFYTHVMKTGGTSLSRAVRAALPADAVYPSEEGAKSQVVAKTFSHLLLGLDPAVRDRIAFFNVHQPAWVAFAVAPDSVKLTVLRDPIARTISHLRQLAGPDGAPDDLAELYADPEWRNRLANHQTQLFADSQGRGAPEAGPVGGAELDDDAKEAYRRALGRFWSTGINRPFAVGPHDYDAAVEMLERYDAVGVTDDLAGMRDRVAAVTGLDLAPVPHVNASVRHDDVAPDLLERIAADNEFDIRLYRHAGELAARPRPPA